MLGSFSVMVHGELKREGRWGDVAEGSQCSVNPLLLTRGQSSL